LKISGAMQMPARLEYPFWSTGACSPNLGNFRIRCLTHPEPDFGVRSTCVRKELRAGDLSGVGNLAIWLSALMYRDTIALSDWAAIDGIGLAGRQYQKKRKQRKTRRQLNSNVQPGSTAKHIAGESWAKQEVTLQGRRYFFLGDLVLSHLCARKKARGWGTEFHDEFAQ
jgi:hypothetical protein